MAQKYKVLLVDDEDLVRSIIRAILEEFGFDVVEACNGKVGLEVFLREKPDLVFTDLQMPELDGLGFISSLKEISPDTPVVVISGTGNIQSAIEAIRIGAWDYITKPVEALESLEIVALRVLERARLIAENKAYQENLEELVMQRTEELRDSEARFRTLFESANDAIILIRDDLIVSCNRKTQELFGCPLDEIVGRSLISFSPLVQPAGVMSDEAHAQRMLLALDGEPQFYEWRHSMLCGTPFDAEISLNRLELHGEPYLQAIMRDISERKKTELVLLDNTRIKRELEIAQEIQQSLLPEEPPRVAGVRIACSCVPAANVGGDYYDFFTLDNCRLDAVIADVAGHSFGSALLMTEVRSVLHAKVNIENSPGKLLFKLNEILLKDLSRAELQLSMFYVSLDLDRNVLSYANAGQTRPLLFHAVDKSFEELDADGLLMGIRSGVFFEEKQVALVAGDILLLHTDGISDADDSSGNFFGVERLCQVVREQSCNDPDHILAEVFIKLAEFTGGKQLADDVTIAIIKIVPS
jgi:phosphoserine phosphatase RsbU/P